MLKRGVRYSGLRLQGELLIRVLLNILSEVARPLDPLLFRSRKIFTHCRQGIQWAKLDSVGFYTHYKDYLPSILCDRVNEITLLSLSLTLS